MVGSGVSCSGLLTPPRPGQAADNHTAPVEADPLLDGTDSTGPTTSGEDSLEEGEVPLLLDTVAVLTGVLASTLASQENAKLCERLAGHVGDLMGSVMARHPAESAFCQPLRVAASYLPPGSLVGCPAGRGLIPPSRPDYSPSLFPTRLACSRSTRAVWCPASCSSRKTRQMPSWFRS